MTATMRLFDVARLVTGLLLATLVSACANLLGPPVVYGTVYSDDSMDLPSDARLEVRLVDLSAGASGESIANVAVDNPGSAPILFAIAYDPARIDEQGRYAVEAAIRAGDRVVYRSADQVAVLTRENPTRVDILVRAVPPPPPPPQPPARVTPAERAVAAIRGSLDNLTKISGSYQTADVDATYEAFLDGDALVAVRESRNFGARGEAKVAFYYHDGILLAYEEEATRHGPAGAAGAARTNRTTLALNFSGGRYTTGRKTVNGTPGQPSETEIRNAIAEARDARDRLIADAALGRTSAGLGPVRFGCADGSKFLVTFSRDPLRAVITGVGHPSAVLLPEAARTGFRYTDGRTDLRGKGREVEIRWDGATRPVLCTAASP
ncbi:MAG TPA: YbaY family lipoprotein [Alphaproteobacteria bacterium]|jgi:putative lipoprotein